MFDTHKQLAWARLKVGIVVTIALVIGFLAVLLAGNLKALVAPKVTITALFTDVKGLRPGAPVWFAGVQIGAVKAIRFQPGERISAELRIDRSALPYLRQDSQARIQTMGLLGDKFVELTQGSKQAPALEPGGSITGYAPPDLGEGLSALAGKIDTGRGSLGRLLSDEALYRDLAAAVKDIRRFAEALNTPDGTMKKLAADREIYERFLSASKALDEFSRRLAASKGTLNKLVEDDRLYENVNNAAAKLNTVLERLEKAEGPAGALIGDKEMKEDLRETIRELRELGKDIKEHPKKYFEFSLF